MSDRTINFGTDDTEATYQIQDDDPLGGGNFAINDLDAATAILEYDQTNDTWVVAEIDVTTANVTTVNGADTSAASANQVLESDGAGNLAFTDPLTTSENVENFASAGAAGTVPVSQGDGTLQMDTIDTSVDAFRTGFTSGTDMNNSSSFYQVNIFDTTASLNEGGFSVSSGDVTVPSNGIYTVSFNIMMQPGTNNTRMNPYVVLGVNNSVETDIGARHTYIRNSSHDSTSANASGVLRLSQGDTLQIFTRQEVTGGRVDTDGEGSFNVVRLGP